MPYKLRKAPKKDLYWVVAVETGKKYSHLPIPLDKAKAQLRVLEKALHGGVLGFVGKYSDMVQDEYRAAQAKNPNLPKLEDVREYLKNSDLEWMVNVLSIYKSWDNYLAKAKGSLDKDVPANLASFLKNRKAFADNLPKMAHYLENISLLLRTIPKSQYDVVEEKEPSAEDQEKKAKEQAAYNTLREVYEYLKGIGMNDAQIKASEPYLAALKAFEVAKKEGKVGGKRRRKLIGGITKEEYFSYTGKYMKDLEKKHEVIRDGKKDITQIFLDEIINENYIKSLDDLVRIYELIQLGPPDNIADLGSEVLKQYNDLVKSLNKNIQKIKKDKNLFEKVCDSFVCKKKVPIIELINTQYSELLHLLRLVARPPKPSTNPLYKVIHAKPQPKPTRWRLVYEGDESWFENIDTNESSWVLPPGGILVEEPPRAPTPEAPTPPRAPTPEAPSTTQQIIEQLPPKQQALIQRFRNLFEKIKIPEAYPPKYTVQFINDPTNPTYMNHVNSIIIELFEGDKGLDVLHILAGLPKSAYNVLTEMFGSASAKAIGILQLERSVIDVYGAEDFSLYKQKRIREVRGIQEQPFRILIEFIEEKITINLVEILLAHPDWAVQGRAAGKLKRKRGGMSPKHLVEFIKLVVNMDKLNLIGRSVDNPLAITSINYTYKQAQIWNFLGLYATDWDRKRLHPYLAGLHFLFFETWNVKQLYDKVKSIIPSLEPYNTKREIVDDWVNSIWIELLQQIVDGLNTQKGRNDDFELEDEERRKQWRKETREKFPSKEFPPHNVGGSYAKGKLKKLIKKKHPKLKFREFLVSAQGHVSSV